MPDIRGVRSQPQNLQCSLALQRRHPRKPDIGYLHTNAHNGPLPG